MRLSKLGYDDENDQLMYNAENQVVAIQRVKERNGNRSRLDLHRKTIDLIRFHQQILRYANARIYITLRYNGGNL